MIDLNWIFYISKIQKIARINFPFGASVFHLCHPFRKCFPLANRTLKSHQTLIKNSITGPTRPITGHIRPIIEIQFCHICPLPDIYNTYQSSFPVSAKYPIIFHQNPQLSYKTLKINQLQNFYTSGTGSNQK